MTHKIKMPQTIYTPYGLGGREGWFILGDFWTDISDAANECVDAMDKKYITDWRVIRTDFDPDTNLPEHVSDVTEEAAATITAWLKSSDREIPHWLAA